MNTYMKNQEAALLGVCDRHQLGAPIGKRFRRKVLATYPRGKVLIRLRQLERERVRYVLRAREDA